MVEFEKPRRTTYEVNLETLWQFTNREHFDRQMLLGKTKLE